MAYFRLLKRWAVLLSCVSCSTSLWALPFSVGSLEGEFDSELSFKSSWSTAKPDHHLIGRNNGGRGFANSMDNGRLNFKRGDNFSRLLKGTHRLQLKYQETGLVLGGRYWYDFVEKGQTQPFQNIQDHGRTMADRSSGGQWQEAFAYQHYQVANRSGTVRLGRQYLNWGEERFIGGGINVINPLDNREGWQEDMDTRAQRLPISLLSLSQQLTDNLSGAFFYQLDWRANAQSNCGSFFSSSDITTHGCINNLNVLSPQSAFSTDQLASLQGVDVNGEGVRLSREKDNRPSSSGQFGVALQYYVEPLKTDMGFYFINYHSRSGFLSGRTANQAVLSQSSGFGGLSREWLAGHSHYFVDYPENIHLYGISFSKDISADFIWRGELSYRPNMPIQLNQVHLFNTLLEQTDADQKIKGYKRKPLTQWQSSITKTADEVMGAKKFSLTGAVGMAYVAALGNSLYGRAPEFGSGVGQCGDTGRYCEKEGFTTRYSWGYRVRGEWEYADVFARTTLKPSISWLHDVKGFSPSNEDVFIEGRKAISVGVKAEYLDTYTVGINYTNFFGGRYNTWSDRDFVAVTMGLKF